MSGESVANTARKKTRTTRKSNVNRKVSKTRTTSRKKKSVQRDLWDETKAMLLVLLGVFLALSVYSELEIISQGVSASSQNNMMGLVGENVAQFLIAAFGWCAYVASGWSFALAYAIWTKDVRESSGHSFFGFLSLTATLVLMLASSAIFSIFWGHQGGGALGSRVAFYGVKYLNKGGALLLSSAVFFVALGVATGLRTSSFLNFLNKIKDIFGEYFLDALFVVKESFVNLVHLINFLAKSAFAFVASLFILLSKVIFSFGKGTNRALANASESIQEKRLKEQQNKSQINTENNDSVSSVKDIDLANYSRSTDGFVLGTESDSKTPKSKKLKSKQKGKLKSQLKSKDATVDDLSVEKPKQAEPIILRKELDEDKPKPSYQLPNRSKRKNKEDTSVMVRKSPVQSYEHYENPSLEILVAGDSDNTCAPDDAELISNSRRLETSLGHFKIGGRVSEVHPGPVITLYQFEPAAGVKVQKIINLADDLALALKVASVRVFAPVPGKGTVGIEVPNSKREMVRLRDVLEGDEYQQNEAPLLLGLGKDTYGEPFISDLAKMPHLLIAGATGTGKSVCINSILLSLLCRNSPDTLRLLLIDPKMLELSTYEDIPHLNAPVVTVPKKARGVLWWAVEEMERRYELMKDLGVRNVAMYNRAVISGNTSGTRFGRKKKDTGVVVLEEKDVVSSGNPNEGLDRSLDANMKEAQDEARALTDAEPLPRIVIVVDELADLMLTVGREIEELLTRLAQKARASGIHLILATQRPSVNVITGLIKANFPARISFKVASKIDARTVLDTSGSERLLGLGDMLFKSPSVGGITRLHSPFVSDKEVHDIVEEIRSQGRPDFDDTIQKMIEKMEESESSSSSIGEIGDDDYDEHYDKAVALVVEKGQASTSMVQRAFRIGYNRAARILDTMERDGVVGPADGSRPRQVLVGSIEP